MDVSGVSKTLNKLQFQQKPLSPIIWVFIYLLWPGNYFKPTKDQKKLNKPELKKENSNNTLSEIWSTYEDGVSGLFSASLKEAIEVFAKKKSIWTSKHGRQSLKFQKLKEVRGRLENYLNSRSLESIGLRFQGEGEGEGQGVKGANRQVGLHECQRGWARACASTQGLGLSFW